MVETAMDWRQAQDNAGAGLYLRRRAPGGLIGHVGILHFGADLAGYLGHPVGKTHHLVGQAELGIHSQVQR